MSLQVVEPATERVLEEIPRAGAEEVDEAVAHAKAAFPAWRDVAPGDRGKLLHGLADALESRLEDLATLEARNAGKPIGDARGEMGMVVDTYRYYAAAPERMVARTQFHARDGDFVLPPLGDAARAQIAALLELVGEGLRRPLHFFPKAAWKYVVEDGSLRAALGAWQSTKERPWGEDRDPAFDVGGASRVVLLRAEGSTWSAGQDLAELQTLDGPAGMAAYLHRATKGVAAAARCPVPVGRGTSAWPGRHPG